MLIRTRSQACQKEGGQVTPGHDCYGGYPYAAAALQDWADAGPHRHGRPYAIILPEFAASAAGLLFCTNGAELQGSRLPVRNASASLALSARHIFVVWPRLQRALAGEAAQCSWGFGIPRVEMASGLNSHVSEPSQGPIRHDHMQPMHAGSDEPTAFPRYRTGSCPPWPGRTRVVYSR